MVKQSGLLSLKTNQADGEYAVRGVANSWFLRVSCSLPRSLSLLSLFPLPCMRDRSLVVRSHRQLEDLSQHSEGSLSSTAVPVFTSEVPLSVGFEESQCTLPFP